MAAPWCQRDSRPQRALTILVFTAAIGGGHEALARAIQADLQAMGHRTTIRDGLRDLSPLVAWVTRWSYVFQLKYARWTIGPLFVLKTHPLVAPRLRTFYGIAYGWRLHRAIRRIAPDVVVSTFPLVTVTLDRLRRTGALRAPVVTVIADYGVHALWIGPATDVHLVASAPSRQLVQRAGGRAIVARMPVAPAFMTTSADADERARLGLPADRFIALITAGAWGVGDIEPAIACAIAAGAFPVVVTGSNTSLYRRLQQRYPDPSIVRIEGWTREMAGLMAAADCLIQNGGGMTCHEAAAVDLPVFFYRPLPGHGAFNATIMEAAGAARRLDDDRELTRALRAAMAGQAPSPPLRQGAPVAAEIVQAAVWGRVLWAAAPRPAAPRQFRLTTLAAALLVILCICLSPWTAGLDPLLVPAAVTASDLPAGAVALVIRVNEPQTARKVEEVAETEMLPVAIFVDHRAAAGIRPSRWVVTGVVQEANSVLLAHPRRERRRAQETVALLRQRTGTESVYFLLPSGGQTLFTVSLMPDHVRPLEARPAGVGTRPPAIVLLDARGLSGEQAVDLIYRTIDEFQEDGWQCVLLPSLS